MTTRENTENFVRKRLSNLIDMLKIEERRSESVDAQQKALRLRTRNQIVRALLRHFHRHDCLAECIVVFGGCIHIKNLLAGPLGCAFQFHPDSCALLPR